MMTDKSSKDDRDLIAAALGLKSSAWAKAVVHLTEAEFHFWQSGIEAAAQLTPDDYLDMAFTELPPSLQRTFKNAPRNLWYSHEGAKEIIEAWLKAGEIELTEEQVLNASTRGQDDD